MSSLVPLLAALAIASPGVPAKTSHEGWPQIDGVLRMDKHDRGRDLHGTQRSDELLGGHASNSIWGGSRADVIWGDYKPCCQPTSQFDHLYGGAGDDFIFASHGTNYIDAGAGDDWVKAHWGRGVIDCGPGHDVLYVSHRNRPLYRVRHCETISHKTLGY